MLKSFHFNRHFKKYEKVIYLGQSFTSSDDVVITTTLGSCVSVVLFDTVLKIGGMNHFMLPEKVSENGSNLYLTESGKYGMQSMEALINSLQKKGGKRRDMVARVFGGSRINGYYKKVLDVGAKNINFAFRFLAEEKIPVISYDVYGCLARRVSFFSKSAKTVVHYITDESRASHIRRDMHMHQRKIRQDISQHEDPILFDL